MYSFPERRYCRIELIAFQKDDSQVEVGVCQCGILRNRNFKFVTPHGLESNPITEHQSKYEMGFWKLRLQSNRLAQRLFRSAQVAPQSQRNSQVVMGGLRHGLQL